MIVAHCNYSMFGLIITGSSVESLAVSHLCTEIGHIISSGACLNILDYLYRRGGSSVTEAAEAAVIGSVRWLQLPALVITALDLSLELSL